MAMTTVPQFMVPAPWAGYPVSGTTTAATMNASGDRCAMVLRAPKAGTLHSFEFLTGTVSNNPDNGLRLSFQDVSTANGDPDGAQDQYCDITGTISNSTWQVPGHALTNDGTSGGTKRTVAAGERVGCVIDFVSFVAGDSLTIAGITPSATTYLRNNYLDDASTGSYVKSSTIVMPIALKYDDGTYGEFACGYILPCSSFTATTYSNASAADERALRFQVPVPLRVIGCWIAFDCDGECDVVLYDNASSVLASSSEDPDTRNLASTSIHFFYFNTKVSLSAATTYRVSIKPTSATSLSTTEFNVNANANLGAVPGGTSWYFSSRVDAGAWTDVDTRRPNIGLIFDGVDTYYSSGGSGHQSAYWG